MTRTLLFTVLLGLATTQPAAASPELRLSIGGGAAAAYDDPCGYGAPPDCVGERVRVAGAAPMVLGGIRGRFQLTRSWRWRAGATASVLLIAPGTRDHGSLMTAAGEVGIERGRFAFDLVLGISRVRIEEDQMSRSGTTAMPGFALTARVTPTLSMFGRLDFPMMHAPTGGAFVGGGLEWTPRI